jgi:hypothetical protein
MGRVDGPAPEELIIADQAATSAIKDGPGEGFLEGPLRTGPPMARTP